MKKTVSDAVEYYDSDWPFVPSGFVLFFCELGKVWRFDSANFDHPDWQFVCTRAEFEAEVERRKCLSNLVDSYNEMMGKRPLPEVGDEYNTSFGPVTIVAVDRGSFRVCVRHQVSGLHLIGYEQLLPLKTPQDREAEEMVAALEPYCNLTVNEAKRAIEAGVKVEVKTNAR